MNSRWSTIYCGHMEWKLHKVILSSGTDWFHTTISEGSTDEVRIQDQDPEAVGWVLEWIYAGVVLAPAFEEASTRYGALIRLFQCAQYFNLNGLCNDCVNRIEQILLETSGRVQYSVQCGFDGNRILGLDDLEGFIDGVTRAYELDDGTRLRSAFTKFLTDCHFWIILDLDFCRKGQEMPAFWQCVLEGLMEAVADDRYGYPAECIRCGRDPTEGSSIRWSSIHACIPAPEGVCDRCVPREFGQVFKLE
ncbi:hypothetical protein GGS24DRAFT_507358 [Hypoxylon argillaceum]|nr:hypothetical protein GGS24DRAFT_507358 [Hypoxylon argillaceum]